VVYIYVVGQKLVPAFINILLIQSKIRLVSLENTSKDPISINTADSGRPGLPGIYSSKEPTEVSPMFTDRLNL
jgi:hypothetical protein